MTWVRSYDSKGTSGRGINLAFADYAERASDGYGFDGYNVYRDGKLLGFVLDVWMDPVFDRCDGVLPELTGAIAIYYWYDKEADELACDRQPVIGWKVIGSALLPLTLASDSGCLHVIERTIDRRKVWEDENKAWIDFDQWQREALELVRGIYEDENEDA